MSTLKLWCASSHRVLEGGVSAQLSETEGKVVWCALREGTWYRIRTEDVSPHVANGFEVRRGYVL